MGEVQGPWIQALILSGLQNKSITPLHQLISYLKEVDSKRITTHKLNSLSSISPKKCIPFDWKLDTAGMTVIKLDKGYEEDTLMMLMEMFLSTLYNIKKYGQLKSNIPLIFVLDECMLLNWHKGWSAHRLMIRGRKEGMCAWLSNQYIPTSKEAQIWEEADMRIYFQPTSDEATKISKKLAKNNTKLQKYYDEQLSYLARGQFLFKQHKTIQISQIPSQTESLN